MVIVLRTTGLASPANQDWADYTIFEHGRAIGRLYEDRHAQPELRWRWSITVIGASHADIATSGRAATLEEAKAQFQASYRKWLVDLVISQKAVDLAAPRQCEPESDSGYDKNDRTD